MTLKSDKQYCITYNIADLLFVVTLEKSDCSQKVPLEVNILENNPHPWLSE